MAMAVAQGHSGLWSLVFGLWSLVFGLWLVSGAAYRDEGVVRIGLISDTHGLYRPGVAAALARVELILHAGDVGSDDILRELRATAPVHAVFGNVDDPQNPNLEREIEIDAGRTTIHVSHGHELGSPTPEKLLGRYTATVIVYGHTHRALIHRAGPRLVVNPGAAGPRRFDVRPSVATLTVASGTADAEIIWLD